MGLVRVLKSESYNEKRPLNRELDLPLSLTLWALGVNRNEVIDLELTCGENVDRIPSNFLPFLT